MENTLFSIIIPTFNSEKTLNKCLNSIVAQTFTDYEILLIDGLSTDSTIDVIKEYSFKFRNIRWVSENDKGIYDAMNKGIKMAKGKWIYFLGSDDTFYDNDVLKNIESFINKNSSIEIVYGNVYSTRFNGIYNGEFSNEKILNQNICHQSIFFKKDVFKKIGQFDLKYKAHADHDHNLKWFLSKRIINKYTSLVIANYADGGFSSVHADDVFIKDKKYKYLLYGKKTLDRNAKVALFKSELRSAIKAKQGRRTFTILLNSFYFLS